MCKCLNISGVVGMIVKFVLTYGRMLQNKLVYYTHFESLNSISKIMLVGS